MIDGFVKYTAPLDEYEEEVLIPIMVKCLEKHIGKENAITNTEMRCKLAEHGYGNINEVRVRKIISHIRQEGLVPCLVGTGRGYHVATSVREMNEYVESLNSRIDAMIEVRNAMMLQRDVLKAKED